MKGIGNGISLIIFGGIIARVPSSIHATKLKMDEGTIGYVTLAIFAIFAVLVIIGIIEIQQGERRDSSSVRKARGWT